MPGSRRQGTKRFSLQQRGVLRPTVTRRRATRPLKLLMLVRFIQASSPFQPSWSARWIGLLTPGTIVKPWCTLPVFPALRSLTMGLPLAASLRS